MEQRGDISEVALADWLATAFRPSEFDREVILSLEESERCSVRNWIPVPNSSTPPAEYFQAAVEVLQKRGYLNELYQLLDQARPKRRQEINKLWGKLDSGDNQNTPSWQTYTEKVLKLTQDRSGIDERFVTLSLVLDQRQQGAPTGPERWKESVKTYESLSSAVDDNPNHDLVVVGEPGSGKSTLASHFARLLVTNVLTDKNNPVPFLVALREYENSTGVSAWLDEQWKRLCPSTSLEAALRSRPFVLILDGLNELPRDETGQLDAQLKRWRSWLSGFHNEKAHQHRVILTCRKRDLSASLSTESRSVRLLEIEPLTPEKVDEFIEVYAGKDAAALKSELEAPHVAAGLYRTPLNLTLLIELYQSYRLVPPTRATLFTAHIALVLSRELAKTESDSDKLCQWLSQSDRVALSRHPYNSEHPYTLPEDGPLLRVLSEFAYSMQESSLTQESGHVSMDISLARQRFLRLETAGEISSDFDSLVRIGAALNLLSSSVHRVEFILQPIQEFLAARWLRRQSSLTPYVELIKPPWDAKSQNLEKVVSELKEDDPIPRPPTTGWEETFLMAAEMALDVSALREMRSVVPSLAGRACAQAYAAHLALQAPLHPSIKEERSKLQVSLLEQSQDPAVDLRLRIQAGEALGELGHPELVKKQGPHGDFIEPKLVPISGGAFTMGDDDSNWSRERPAHERSVASFQLGKYPVTRLEFACFVDAKGYGDPKWWEGKAAQEWFSGRSVGEGRKWSLRDTRAFYRNKPERLEESDVTPPAREFWEEKLGWSDEQFESWLEESEESGKQSEPWRWRLSRYMQPSYPIIGVSFYEAQAYLAWLNTQTETIRPEGHIYRLPSETEWERSARGLIPSQKHPFGSFLNPLRHANVYESHIRGLTPVGVFPEGRSSEGCADLSGLVWEWTSSAWTANHESQEIDNEIRVVRGGSWGDPMDYARGAYRYGDPLDVRNYDLGFRLCLAPPLQSPET